MKLEVALCSILAVVIDLSPSNAASWYVDNVASGSANGTTWSDAWLSPAGINWNSVSPGDTVYISGGPSGSSQVYTNLTANGASQCLMNVGKAGTLGNVITVAVGQDALHNGTVILDALSTNWNIVNAGRSYFHMTGDNGSGSMNLVLRNAFDLASADNGQGIANGSVVNWEIDHFIVTNCGNGITVTSGGTTAGSLTNANAGVYIHDFSISCMADHAIAILGNTGVTQTNYDINLIYNGIYLLASIPTNGFGPDANQFNGCCTVSNCIASSPTNLTVIGVQHQDWIGDPIGWIKSVRCTVSDMADALTMAQRGIQHFQYFNNVFRITNPTLAYPRIPHGIVLMYLTGLTPNFDATCTDVQICNNTFVDFNGYNAIQIDLTDSTTTVQPTNFNILNNIIYDCGRPGSMQAIRVSSQTSDQNTNSAAWEVVIDYNVLHPGAGGDTNITVGLTNNVGQVHGQYGAPEFVSYSAFNPANNLHIAASDTAARGNGTNLYAGFTALQIDRDLSARPSAGAWDIGAYEYVPPQFSAGTVRAGRIVRAP